MEPLYVYETIMDQTITASTPAAVADVSGFRKFSLLTRLEGPASATVRMEINHGNLLVAQETLQLNAAGWLNFAKEYPVFAPKIGVVLYHPSGAIKVRMTLYAGL